RGRGLVRGAAVRHREYLQDLRREFSRPGAPAAHPTGGARDRRAGIDRRRRGGRELRMGNPVEAFDALAGLALNLRWSWDHAADELWGRLDPELWNLTRNPWLVLQTVSREKLQGVAADPAFRQRLDEVLHEKREGEQSARWFQRAHPNSPLRLVAYFSMEY